MSRVVILGAGASFGARVECPPPMIKDFFRFGLKRVGDHYWRLWDILSSLGFPQDQLMDGTANLERVYSDLDGWELWLGKKSVKEVQEEVGGSMGLLRPSYLLHCFVLEVLREVSTQAVLKPCIYHKALFNSLQEGDTIISFNYDLIAEGALVAARNWSPVFGYGFHSFGDAIGDNPDHWIKTARATKVRLLKAHGSVNWRIGDDHDVESTSITSIPDPGAKVIWAEREISRMEKYGIDWTEFPRLWPMIPPAFIVPPTFNKFASDTPPKLKVVWSAIESALREASSILAVGFAFSPADTHFCGLFKAQLKKNNRLRMPLQLVNPDPTLVEKVGAMSSKLDVSLAAKTLREFVENRIKGACIN